jgi:hypothetical protein
MFIWTFLITKTLEITSCSYTLKSWYTLYSCILLDNYWHIFMTHGPLNIKFTMYLQFFVISWHSGNHNCPKHPSLAIRVTTPEGGATRTVPNWSTTDMNATNLARSFQLLLVCSGSTVNFTSILFSSLCTLLIKLTEFNLVKFVYLKTQPIKLHESDNYNYNYTPSSGYK